ncbi:SUMF1/EgtB/PvdO family nonheme iron enzyme [Pararobbsia silviterrae]|nr:SUMF1/EgtB/PvdO family nonheme iron enzyme [Pararobbsia silviterrae]
MTKTSPTPRDAWPLLLARLDHARAATDSLFGLLVDDAFYDRTIAERHRIGFYRGHLDAFDWNLFNGRLFDRASVNPAHDRLFAFGIDPIDGQLPSDSVSDWPARAEVEQYCCAVREIIDGELRRCAHAGVVDGAAGESAARLLNVAIEHRLMHAETLAYLLHQLPLDRKVEGPRSFVPDAPRVEPSMVEIPAGRARLGMPADATSAFGWCNEFDGLDVDVPAFSIDTYMVSNGAFLAFVEAGGYRNPAYWSEADWAWREANGIEHPVFWRRARGEREDRGVHGVGAAQGAHPSRDVEDAHEAHARLAAANEARSDGGASDSARPNAAIEASGEGTAWTFVTMFDEIALPLNWPVYVSYAEASAYARWAGKQLPSEAQWQRAAGARHAHHGNFDFAYFDPMAVDADLHERSEAGVVGMWGNGWEWTRTTFGPLPGFEAFECYPGYSANFFDGEHYVLKGGSMRTASCMIRPSFRNWFQPRYPYVYAGFRCVDA